MPGSEFTFFMAPSTNSEGYDADFTDYLGFVLNRGVSPDASGNLNPTLPVSLAQFSVE